MTTNHIRNTKQLKVEKFSVATWKEIVLFEGVFYLKKLIVAS
jgi:hypothetical protein